MEKQNVSINNSIDNSINTSTEYVSYEHPPPPKRGRAYAPMGEFDLSLIREFRACPALYDRNSESFRDKLFTSHQWQEISNKLGYDVSLLKDRMLQLRNRYNLEKRRLEQLRDENPGQHVDSPWPLFDHLHFLSEHIRPRRSYRSMLPRNPSLADTGDDEDEQPRRRPQRYAALAAGTLRESLSDGGEGGDGGGGVADTIINSAEMTPFANGMLTVKMEEDADGDNANANASDVESGSQSGNENVQNHRAHPLKLSAASTLLTTQKRQLHSMPLFNKAATPATLAMKTRSLKYTASSAVHAPPATIKIRRLDTMQDRSVAAAAAASPVATQSAQPRTNIPDKNNHFNNNNNTTNNDNNNNTNSNSRSVERPNQDGSIPTATRQPAFNMQVNRRCLTNSEQKYAAFGDFVTASLLELPAARALQLVEKFTTEVVRVLLDSKTSESAVQQEQQQQQPQLQTQPFSHMNGSIAGEAVNGV